MSLPGLIRLRVEALHRAQALQSIRRCDELNTRMDARVKSAHDGEETMIGGRLTSDPNRSSLGLLPSGPDPVGEWLVHRQPPVSYIGGTERECKPGADALLDRSASLAPM